MMAGACALQSSLVFVGSSSPARAAELPAYLQGIVGTSTSSAGEVATKNILQLNTSMFDLYGDAGLTFRKNILAQHPVILALFSGAGGRFILYRPGMASLDAPPVLLATDDTPVPYAGPLEEAWLPSVPRIVAAARRLVAY